jgi:predicted dehydrogenase
MCETPGVTSAEDVALVRAAIEASGAIYQTAFCLRHAPIYRKLKGLLEDWRSEGGEPFCLDIRYYEWIHHFYNLALYLSGDVTELRAWELGGSRRIVMAHANGDLGTIRTTAFQNHAIPYEEVELTRKDGMLRAVDRSELRSYRHPDAISTREMTFDTAGGTVWRYSTSVAYNRLNTLYASGYAAEIEGFAECIRTGRKPVSTLEDAAATEAIRRAVEASVAEGRSVAVGKGSS